MSRGFLVAIIAFLAGGAVGGLLVSQGTTPKKETARLVRQNDLLLEETERLRRFVTHHERAKILAANKAVREVVEKDVAEIRGLPFKNPVDYNVLNRQEIKATISGKLAEVFTDQEFTNMAAGLAAIGLLEPEFPLRETYLNLLGEQVAAFYDQHQHKLFMFEDASLDNAQNRVILAHELTHALQDQHFSLKRLPLEIKDNDDRAAAAAALVEGDATLVMSEYMLRNLSLATLKDSLTATITQNMEQLAKAPRYLREMLVFPYLRGQEFCGALYGGGGYPAITKAFDNPPTSTTQILHPEKYLANPREEPIPIGWPDRKVRDEEPIADNVVGELGMRILFGERLDDATGERTGAGWRGDRYLCYDGGRALVWKSIWANEKEAAEFIEAEKQILERRWGKDGAQAADVRFIRVLSPRPNEVVVIDAATAEWGQALLEKFGG